MRREPIAELSAFEGQLFSGNLTVDVRSRDRHGDLDRGVGAADFGRMLDCKT